MITKFKLFEISHKDIDPYNEEIWKEPVELNVGDAVEIVGPVMYNHFNLYDAHVGLKGIIIPINLSIHHTGKSYTDSRTGLKIYQIRTRWPEATYKFEKDNPMRFFPMYVPLENLKRINKRKYLKYLKDLENELEDKYQKDIIEKELRRKEYMIKMKDVDPYGEEDWDI